MILATVYKTRGGATRRCLFENAHSHTHVYRVTRFFKGERDWDDWKPERERYYKWRVSKMPKAR